ncbi:MAG: hypothetical protein JWN44_2114 [Myxococcales bacterium]|nr:hypothetical protein [Myxococcales bacterium]
MKVWRKASGSPGAAAIPQGGGAPLPADVRDRMQPKLGADLSGVRIHTDGGSADAARGLGARAFTVGSDVHFNAGQFEPGTREGDKLIAHELTHVVQGQRSGIQRKAEDGREHEGGEDKDGGDKVSSPDEPAEKEADAVSEGVADKLHGGKKGGKGAGEQAGDKQAGDKEAGGQDAGDKDVGNKEAGDAGHEKAPQIGAKLEGLGRKIFRSPGEKSNEPKIGATLQSAGRRIFRSPGGQPKPEEKAREVLKKNKQSVTTSITELNTLGLTQQQMVAILLEAYQASGRAAFPQTEKDKSIVLLSRRLGAGQPVVIVSTGGAAAMGSADIQIDPKNPMNIIGTNVTR